MPGSHTCTPAVQLSSKAGLLMRNAVYLLVEADRPDKLTYFALQKTIDDDESQQADNTKNKSYQMRNVSLK